MIFLHSIFGYLCFLIIYKWVAVPHLAARADAACDRFLRENPDADACTDTLSATPDLFNVMINMFLKPGSTNENELFWGQGVLQLVLLFAALVAVPVMLLPKPLILRARHKRRAVRASASCAAGLRFLLLHPRGFVGMVTR